MKNNYKFWIIFSLIVVFAAGAVGGIFLQKNFIQTETKKMRKEKRSVHFPTLEIMAKELSLTPEQEEKIRGIFKDNEEKLKNLKNFIHQRLTNVRSQLKSEIKNVLTTEQKLKFEAMIARYLQQRKKERGGRNEQRKEKGGKR